MNSIFTKRSISLALIITILWHIVIVHNVFQNYVICYGNDGHIEIENPLECENCSYPVQDYLLVAGGNTVLNNNDCEDMSLDENCFDDNQFITKNNVNFSLILIKSNFIKIQPEQINNLFKVITNEITRNNILSNYSTVSLQI